MTTSFEKMYHTWDHFSEKFYGSKKAEMIEKDQKYEAVMRILNEEKEKKQREKGNTHKQKVTRARTMSA